MTPMCTFRRYLKPTPGTALPPILLVLLAVLDPLILRLTLFALLAIPLRPVIDALGWVYRDKPMFLTYPASLLAAVVWAPPLYVVLCAMRFLWRGRASSLAE